MTNPELEELLATLARNGVRSYESYAGLKIEFFNAPKSDVDREVFQKAPAEAGRASTPEHSGTADVIDPPPRKPDIFDVLESGRIPGAPTADGAFSGTPE